MRIVPKVVEREDMPDMEILDDRVMVVKMK